MHDTSKLQRKNNYCGPLQLMYQQDCKYLWGFFLSVSLAQLQYYRTFKRVQQQKKKIKKKP